MIGERPNCLDCKHYDWLTTTFTCDAFPQGIPDDIIMGRPHLAPIKGQGNGIVYEKLEKRNK